MHAGALQGTNSSFTLHDSMFLNNSAAFGGAVSMVGGALAVANCTFSGNSGSQVAPLLGRLPHAACTAGLEPLQQRRGSLQLQGCRVQPCSASLPTGCWPPCHLGRCRGHAERMGSPLPASSSAGPAHAQGGAISWVNGTSAALQDTILLANSATASGGALYVQSCTGGLALSTCEVTYNTATQNGGSIFQVRHAEGSCIDVQGAGWPNNAPHISAPGTRATWRLSRSCTGRRLQPVHPQALSCGMGSALAWPVG